MYSHTLMRGNPPPTTSTRPLRIDFPLHPCSQLKFLTFSGQDNRTSVKGFRAHERALLPNRPTPTIFIPPHLPIITCQGKSHACIKPPPQGTFPLLLAQKYVSTCTQLTLFFPFSIFCQPRAGVIPTPPLPCI